MFIRSSAEVLEENNYYAFGLKHDTNILSVNNSSYKYQYNGKELQTETGWNDYGARMYMSDIARWGVIDPLSETSRRFSPYNYAYDNPISFVDPDGRKAMAPNNWEWNNPMGGALGYMIGGGSATFGSFAEFLGEENPLAKFNNRETGGGGGSGTMIGDIMRSVGITLGSLESFMQMSFVLNLRQQLIDANLNPDAKANFNDWEKLVNSNEIPTLKGLYAILTANGAIMKFQEYNGGAPGLEEGHKISFNMNLIQNVLKYAYTIGHEMYHTFVGDNKSIYDNFVNQSTTVTSQGFQLFKEFASYSLEITWGNDRIGNPWTYVVDNYGPNSTKIPENRRYKQNVIDFIKPIRSDLNILYYNAYQKALKRLQQ